jgi:hypothetical protein
MHASATFGRCGFVGLCSVLSGRDTRLALGRKEVSIEARWKYFRDLRRLLGDQALPELVDCILGRSCNLVVVADVESHVCFFVAVSLRSTAAVIVKVRGERQEALLARTILRFGRYRGGEKDVRTMQYEPDQADTAGLHYYMSSGELGANWPVLHELKQNNVRLSELSLMYGETHCADGR